MINKFQKFMIRALKCRVNRIHTIHGSNFIQQYIFHISGSFAVNGSGLGGKGREGESYLSAAPPCPQSCDGTSFPKLLKWCFLMVFGNFGLNSN